MERDDTIITEAIYTGACYLRPAKLPRLDASILFRHLLGYLRKGRNALNKMYSVVWRWIMFVFILEIARETCR